MSLNDHDRRQVQAFFQALEPLRKGYTGFSFSYFALRQQDKFILMQGRLFLNTLGAPLASSHFQSTNVKAGRFSLDEMGSTVEQLVEQLVSGKIKMPGGELEFPPRENGAHGAYYQPFHTEGLQQNNRLNVLGLVGTSAGNLLQQPNLDWELKAADPPFGTISDLSTEYQLGVLRNDAANVEIIGFNVAVVDAKSTVKKNRAKLGILIPRNSERDQASLGYVVYNKGKAETRSVLNDSDLTWAKDDEVWRGEAEIEVPAAAVVFCIARYAGVAQHQGWISDQTTFQNPRRAIYEAFDKQSSILKDALAREGRGKSRDLEAAVAWLLWMLGFSSAHLGERVQEGPDVLVSTPSGNLAIVECTTGLLKADQKLSHLHDRSLYRPQSSSRVKPRPSSAPADYRY
jgi:hypothetical protein